MLCGRYSSCAQKLYKCVNSPKLFTLSKNVPPKRRSHHTIERGKSGEKAEREAEKALLLLNEGEKKQLHAYLVEKEIMLASGELVPENLNNRMLLHLSQNCQDFNNRKKMFRLWAVTEIRRAQEKAHLERRLIEEAQKVENESRSIILFSQDQKIQSQYNNLCYAMLHGPDVLIDMGFEEYMDQRELADATNQVKYAYSNNKAHREPIHLTLCNLQYRSKTHALLERNLPNLCSEKPITVTSKSYLDMYPRKNLVYLTNESSRCLTEYNENEVYIIGGFVDKPHRTMTAIKAKQEGIRTAALPIEEHFEKYQKFHGRKDLPINIVLSILLDFRVTKDWKYCLKKHIPQRHTVLVSERKYQFQDERLLSWKHANMQYF